MAKYKNVKIRWNPATEVDVVGYKVYADVDNPVDYESPYTVYHTRDKALDGEGKFFLDIPTDFPDLPLVDAEYFFGACAVDDFGNEGDLLVMTAPLDFLAPAVLSGGEILVS